MNPSRTVRCDVCAPINFKRADRGAHAEAVWAAIGPTYRRLMQRLPTGLNRCASCAAKAGQRRAAMEKEARAWERELPRPERPSYAAQKEASETRAKARREVYRKPAKANRHSPNRRRMA